MNQRPEPQRCESRERRAIAVSLTAGASRRAPLRAVAQHELGVLIPGGKRDRNVSHNVERFLGGEAEHPLGHEAIISRGGARK